MKHPHDGDQLELGLFAGEPWGGQSPRVLTRGFSGLFLRQKPPSHEVIFHDPAQLELWCRTRPHGERGPSLSGAPLLLEPYSRRGRKPKEV